MLLKRIFSMGILVITTLLLCACNDFVVPHSEDPYYAPKTPYPAEVRTHTTGSVYNEETAMILFETRRARHVGDLITVILDEQFDSKTKSTSKIKKNNKTESKNPNLYGAAAQFNLPKFLPLAFHKDNSLDFKLEANRSFDGQGESKQNNKLTGTITVSVAQVLPNGYLKIRGEKWLHLNQGKEYVRLTGIVRPTDIRPDNSVSSQRIADARIAYSGTGQMADSNTMGWVAKFFNSIYWVF